jgi:hypothetical protein
MAKIRPFNSIRTPGLARMGIVFHNAVYIVREVVKNTAMALPPVRGWRLRRPRAVGEVDSSHAGLDRFAFGPLRDLTRFVGRVEGLNVFEIGPGDNLVFALALLASGAASYTAIDRFLGDTRSRFAKAWYLALEQAWPEVYPTIRWPGWLRADSFPEAYSSLVRVFPSAIEGLGDEDFTRLGPQDVVCSNLVGEHVSDILAFALATTRLLGSSGVAVHRVDFGPHDCWVQHPDPLVFLGFPDWLWWLMGSNRGLPNRRRFHEFCAAFEAVELKVDIRDRKMLLGGINRRRLAPRFRSMPSDSLATLNATFVCRRQSNHDWVSSSPGLESDCR